MRTQQQFLADYAKSHRNPVNQLVHFICVPAIVFSTLGLLWLLPLGRWLGLEGGAAAWLNGATLLGALSGVFYARLSLLTLAQMSVWFAVSVALILAVQGAGWPLGWICGALWVAAWIVQVWGHKVEGAKPSFADDVIFLLVGPLFVMHEIGEKLGRTAPRRA